MLNTPGDNRKAAGAVIIPMEFDRFGAAVCTYFGLSATGLSMLTGLFDDLELDSIQAMRLLFVLEEWADVLLPPPDIPVLLTLGDAFNYYRDLCEL